MKITAIVLAVKVEPKTEQWPERRKVDLEGIEASIVDTRVATPPARREIEAEIYVNTRQGSKGLFRVYEVTDWKLYEPEEV